MKYFYQMVVALCLLVAVQTSNSQECSFDYGAKDGKRTGVCMKVWTSSDNTFDGGLGWLAEGDTFSEHDGLYDGQNSIQVYRKYLGRLPDYTRSIETVKQAIIVDLKIPIPLFDIVGLNVDQKSNGYLFRIHCTKQLPNFESWLKPIGDDTWLYITLADAQADVAVLEDFKLTAFVKKILIFQSATSVQLTLLLKGQVNSVSLIPVEGSRDILVAVFTPTEEQLTINKAR
jgi:hypothetical protein